LQGRLHIKKYELKKKRHGEERQRGRELCRYLAMQKSFFGRGEEGQRAFVSTTPGREARSFPRILLPREDRTAGKDGGGKWPQRECEKTGPVKKVEKKRWAMDKITNRKVAIQKKKGERHFGCL